MAIPLDDIVADPSPCDCEFTPDQDEPTEETFHYLRRCKACGRTSWSLHCPHDGFQRECHCGQRLPQVKSEG